MHPEVIDTATESVFTKIGNTALAQQFYLAGGTALALQLGHRISHDLDLFTDKTLNVIAPKRELERVGSLTVSLEDKKTLTGTLDGVRVSFFEYPYPLHYDTRTYNQIEIADPRDIAAMKIDAISSRGSKKDFFDIFALMHVYSLAELIGEFEARFHTVEYNLLHVLKSLTYFEDADAEPDPDMRERVAWTDVKEKIAQEAMRLLREKI